MNLSKSYEFFKPEDCKGRVHIIGCGAVGSTVAENIARLGVTDISLYDFDTVDSKNIANQMFTEKDIGKLKVEAVARMICRINPDIRGGLYLYENGYTDQNLSGHVFLCVDNIDLRRKICEDNRMNQNILSVYDFRMGLTDGQHYAADWSKSEDRDRLLGTMNFSHAEAAAETPVSACNQVLSVAPTVRALVAFGVANFMNFVKTGRLNRVVLVNAFGFDIEAYE